MVGLGGTVRALAKIDQQQRSYPLGRLHGYELSLASIEHILHEMQSLPVNKRAKIPGLNSDRADVILAGAIALARLMRQVGYNDLVVCGQGLREGLFYEQFLHESEAPLVPDVRAFGLANLTYLYDVNWPHALHVERLATSLFDQLRSLHGYGAFERAVLSGAALLHDVGVAIDFYNHDEHSAYLILNADLPGFTHREIALMALLTEHHRRGTPDIAPFRGLLAQADEDCARKLSALLRLAEYLERSRTQVVQSIKCRLQAKAVQLTCLVRGDASTEVWSTQRNAEPFRQTFKRDLVIRTQLLPEQARTPSEVGERTGVEPLWARVQEIMERFSAQK